jgi:hypothetical protein
VLLILLKTIFKQKLLPLDSSNMLLGGFFSHPPSPPLIPVKSRVNFLVLSQLSKILVLLFLSFFNTIIKIPEVVEVGLQNVEWAHKNKG